MASRKNARDSGICLSAVRQISKILIRVSRCSSDSEQSCTEEAAQIKRHSGRPSRIPIPFSRRQGSESYSSEDNEYKSEPNKIDSGKDCYWLSSLLPLSLSYLGFPCGRFTAIVAIILKQTSRLDFDSHASVKTNNFTTSDVQITFTIHWTYLFPSLFLWAKWR